MTKTMTGGSIKECSIAGRSIPCAADADVQIDLGGQENRREANGDQRTSRLIWETRPWRVDGLVLAIDLAADELDTLAFLQAVAACRYRGIRGDAYDITLTLVTGHVYGGAGNIEGAIALSTMRAIAPVTLSGHGGLQLEQPASRGFF